MYSKKIKFVNQHGKIRRYKICKLNVYRNKAYRISFVVINYQQSFSQKLTAI